MIVVLGMLLVGVVVVAGALLLGLRRWMLDESRTEERVRSAATHKVAYVVPEGQDPLVLKMALAHAGFTTVLDFDRGVERLLIECAEQDRARVRATIEGTHRASLDGPEILVGHVIFEDER